MTHDLTEAASHHRVRCWIRERLVHKLTSIIVTAEKSSALSPGMAAKLYGCVNLFELGVFCRVARGGLNAFKDRQYSHDTQLSSELRRAFHIMLALVELRPERVVHLGPRLSHRFVAASDAAWELSSGGGSGGYMLVLDPGLATESRLARVASLPLSLYRCWHFTDTCIAQLELYMVYLVLIWDGAYLRGRTGIWLIDNTAALIALISGRSNSDDLDTLAAHIQSALFSLECVMYFEWVQSDSNWADGISRRGFEEWHRRHHFHPEWAFAPPILLYLLTRAVIRLFSFF